MADVHVHYRLGIQNKYICPEALCPGSGIGGPTNSLTLVGKLGCWISCQS